MKILNNNLFDFLNYVLKVSDSYPKDYKEPVFLINRWLSMTNPSFAKICNLTTNKWYCHLEQFNVKGFYRTILPKYTKRISYIKKEAKENEIEEDVNMASIMECSQREINFFKETLEEMNIGVK
jgi:hypothetical protein